MTDVVRKRRLHIAAFTSSLGQYTRKCFLGTQGYKILLQKRAFLWQQADAELPAYDKALIAMKPRNFPFQFFSFSATRLATSCNLPSETYSYCNVDFENFVSLSQERGSLGYHIYPKQNKPSQ